MYTYVCIVLFSFCHATVGNVRLFCSGEVTTQCQTGETERCGKREGGRGLASRYIHVGGERERVGGEEGGGGGRGGGKEGGEKAVEAGGGDDFAFGGKLHMYLYVVA